MSLGHVCCYHVRCADVLLREGCCFAVGVDILQELLDMELFSHPLLRDQTRDPFVTQLRALIFPTDESLIFPNSGKFSINFYDTYRPDRSSVYAQVLCNLFVDRSCSRGANISSACHTPTQAYKDTHGPACHIVCVFQV